MSSGGFMSSVVGRLFHGKEREGRGHKRRSPEAQMQISSPLSSPLPPSLSHSASSLTSPMTSPMMSSSAPPPVSPMTQSSASPLLSTSMASSASPLTSSPASSSLPSSSTPLSDVQGMKKWEHSRRKASMELLANAQQPPLNKSFSDTQSNHNSSICSDSTVENKQSVVAAASLHSSSAQPVSSSPLSSPLSPPSSLPSSPFASPVSPLSAQSPSSSSSMANLATSGTTPVVLRRDETNSGKSPLLSSLRKKARPFSCFVAVPETPPSSRRPLYSAEEGTPNKNKEDQKSQNEKNEPRKGENQETQRDVFIQKEKKNEKKGKEQTVQGHTQAKKNDTKKQRKQREKELAKQKEKDKEMAKQREKEQQKRDKDAAKNREKDAVKRRDKQKTKRPLSCIVQPPSPRPDLDRELIMLARGRRESKDKEEKENQHGEWARDQPIGISEPRRRETLQQKHRPVSCFVLPPPPASPPPQENQTPNPNQHQKQNQNHPWERESSAVSEPRRLHHENGRQPKPRPVSCFVLPPPPPSPPPSPPLSPEKQNQPLRPRTPLQTPPPYPGRPKSYFSQEALDRTPYMNQHSRKSPEILDERSAPTNHHPSTKTEMLDQRFSGTRLPAHLSKSEEALDQRPSTPVQLSAYVTRPQHQFLSQSMQALDQQPARSRTPLQQTKQPYAKTESRSSQFIDADFSVKQFYSANQSYTFSESDLPQKVSHQRSASSHYYSETGESDPKQRGKVSHQRSASSSLYYYEAGESDPKHKENVSHQRSVSSSPYYSEVGESDQLQQEKISHRRSASSPFYSEALLALSEPPKKEKKKNSQTPPNRQGQHNAGYKENQYSDFKQHGYSQDGYRDTSRQKSTPAMRSCRSYEQLDLPRSSGNYSPVSFLSGRSDPVCDISKGRYSPASREFQLKLHQDQEYAANISSSNRHSYVHQDNPANVSSSNRHAYVVSDSDSPSVNAKHQDKDIHVSLGSPLSHYENTSVPATQGSPASPYENANFVSNHREKEGYQRRTPPTLHGAQTPSNSSHVYDTPTTYPSKTGGNSGGPLSYDLKSFFPSMTAEEKSYHLSMTSEEESSFPLTTPGEKSYSPSVKQDQRSLTPSMTPDQKRFTPPMVSDQKSHHHSHSTTSEQKSHYHSMTSGQRSYSPSMTSDKNSHAHYHSTTSDIRSYSPSMTSDHKSHSHSHHTSSDQRSYSPSMTSSDQKVHSHLTSATSSPRRPQRPQSACFLCQPPPCCSQGQRSARPVSQCYLPNCSLPGWCPGPGLGWDPSDDRVRSSSPYLASSNARSSSPYHFSPTPYSGSSPPAPQRSSTRSDSNSQPRVTFGPTYSIPVAASSHSSPAFTTHATNQVDSRTSSVAVCIFSQVSSDSSKISVDSSMMSSHSRPISSYSTSAPASHSSPTASHSIPLSSHSIPTPSHSRSEPSSHSNEIVAYSSTAASRASPTDARSSPHSSSSSPTPSQTASILKRQQRIEDDDDDDDDDGQSNTERSGSCFSRNDANRKSKAGYFSIHDEREKSNVERSGSYFSRNDALRKSNIEGSASYFSSNDEPRKGNAEGSDRYCFSRKHRKNSSTQTEGEYVTSEEEEEEEEDEEEEAFEEEEEDEEEEEEAEVEELEAAECDEDVEEKAQEEAEEGDKVKEPTNHPSEDSSHTTPDEKWSQEPDKPKETEQQSAFNDTIQSAKSQSSVETFDQSTRPVVSPTLSSSMATPHRQSPIPKPRTWVPKPESVSSVQREEGETKDNGPLRTSSPALETSSPALETSSPALRTSSPAPRPAKRNVPPRPRPRSMCVFAEDDFPLGYASSTTEFRSAFQCGYVASNTDLQRSKVESSNNSVASKPPRSPMKKYKSADCLDRLDESECSEKRPLPSRRQKIPSLTLTSPPSQSPLKKKSSIDCLVGQTQDFLSVENSLTSTSTLTSNCDPARLLTSTPDPVRPLTPIYSYSDTTDTEQQPTGGEERKRRRRRDEIYSSTQLLNKLSEPSSGRRYTPRPRPASWFVGSGDESGYFGNASLGGGGKFAPRARGAGGLSASTNDLLDMMKHGEDCDDLLDVADDELSYDDKCGSLKKALSSGSLLKQSSIQDKSFNVMKRRRQKMKNRRQTQTSPNARSSSTETDEGVDLHHSYSASSLLDQSETATGESATFTGIPLDGRSSRGSGDAIPLDGSSSRGGGDAISLVGRGQGGVVKRLSSAHGNMKAWELRLRRKQIQMKRRSYEMMTEDQPRRETLV